MRFGLLGPLEVVVDGEPVTVPSPKQRVLLASLMLNAGQPVTVDELAEAIWGDDLPADPRKAVQTYVTRLRMLLGGDAIQTRPEGYALAAAPEDVDVGRFETLLARAREAAGQDDRGRQAALLGQALALWRGEPFADLPLAEPHHAAVARLSEQRIEASERRVEAELALGRHTELIGELRALTGRHPLREKLWALLMTALYRCGRQADALETYRIVGRLLAEELGVDPGPELRTLHQATLTNDPALAAPPRAAGTGAALRPAQLPGDVADFVGRDDLVRQLLSLLGDDTGVPIVAVSGLPGAGKTALAVHTAHRLAERFPDGQLFVNLHGATAGLGPLRPLEVLGRFLRALGMDPTAIPTDVEEAGAAFRSRTAGRRLLVVLDDAVDAAQVAPLLPGSPGCGVLVTSRPALVTLDGARHLRLDVLAPEAALELLGRLADHARVLVEPESAAAVARLCGHLPLALRIAAARLVARPGWPVRALADRLADAQRRLDELELDAVGVRASFQVSYQQLRDSSDPLDQAAATAFGLLGMLDGPDVGVDVAGPLLDESEDTAERVLERLVDAQLLETATHGRYRMHDLLRLYARELAAQRLPEPERAAALIRAFGFYVSTAWQTVTVLRPGGYRLTLADDRWRKGGLEIADEPAAFRWLEAEHANLLAAMRQAVSTPGVPPEVGIQLTLALGWYFWVRGHWVDWVQANQVALGVARQVGDRAAQAWIRYDLGYGLWRQGRFEEALACLHESLAGCEALGDRRGRATVLSALGLVYRSQGRIGTALAYLHESLTMSRELGDRRGQANTLAVLGRLHQRRGDDQEALACLHECLDLRRALPDRLDLTRCLGDLALVYQRQGRTEAALDYLRESLAISQELGARDNQADSRRDLGVVYTRQGRYQEALDSLWESLAIRRELGDAHGEAESLRELGSTLRTLGRPEEARARWQQALAIFERFQSTDADQVRGLLADLAS